MQPGLVLAVGPNGAGKTNLLESLHVGTQGFSPRTRADAQLIRFGAEAARIALGGSRNQVPVEVSVTLSTRAAKQATLNGAKLTTAEQLRREIETLVFTPDRLAIVKGGPAARRAYFDRTLARLQPARTSLPLEYAAAIAQRNAALRRVASGLSTQDAIAPWTEQVALVGAALVAARVATLIALEPGFRTIAGELGLAGATFVYEGEPPSVAGLEARLPRDIERATTGAVRICTTFGFCRARAICADSARRASSGLLCSRCSWPRHSFSLHAATASRSCFSTTCCRSSTRRVAASWRTSSQGWVRRL